MTWRDRLLVSVAIFYLVGEVWMFRSASVALHTSLLVLTAVYVCAMVGTFLYYRARLTSNLLTANLALGAIVHLALTALLVAADRLTQLGVIPALATNWHHFVLGAVGILAAVVSWTRARGGTDREELPRDTHTHDEPAPERTGDAPASFDWDHATGAVDPRRQRELNRLRRIARLIEEDPQGALRVVEQEARRVVTDAKVDAKRDDEDALSQVASLIAWGAQKLPELAELDASDLLMGKVIADIRSQKSRVEHRFVDHRKLRAIHPIDRATANDKCDERAQAARDALPLLEAHGMQMSEDLIAAHDELAAFRSVTGFQVVELLDGGFVTFEGNGRREALQRAFGDKIPVMVEVRLYQFDDANTRRTIDRRVQRVRSWKEVVD